MNQIHWQDVAVGLGLSLLIGLVVAQLMGRLIRLGLSAATSDAETARDSFRKPSTRRPIRIVRALAFLATIALVTPPVLEFLGVTLSYGIPLDRLTNWLFTEGLRVLLIVVLAYFAIRMAGLALAHFEEVVTARAEDDADRIEFSHRLQTISGLAKNAVNVLVVGSASLMILQELGINVTPLLTAVGIGGLAIGFGAQNIVRDVISGFFLILEDQIHVGDVVSVEGTTGLVESVKLRTIVLRDLSGTVHVIPNGAITTLSNLTREFSYSVIDVGVAYKEDTDHVVDVLRQVGSDLQTDPAFSAAILASLEVLGVNDFADSAVTIKIRIKTRPLKQWMVGRELRRRIKKAFDAQGIEIPFPHLSVYFGEVSKPFLTHELDADAVARAADAKPLPTTPPERRRTLTTLEGDDAPAISK